MLCRRKGEAENTGNSQSRQDEQPEMTPQLKNVGKGETPADLLELIPSGAPIEQAKLFEAARAAGINQKYARQFLSVLIAEKRVLVRKIPREKAKSALGYIRADLSGSQAHTARRCATEELSRRS
jgi:hypothetical protein